MGLKLQSVSGGSVELNSPITTNTYVATMPAQSGTVMMAENYQSGFKNRIINGDMNVWQRNTSYTGTGNGDGTNAYGFFAADRWWCQVNSGTSGGSGCSMSQSRQTFTPGQTAVPGNPQYFMRLQAAALGTLGTGDAFIRTQQTIEDVNTFSGQSATLSFYAKADSSRTYGVVIRQMFGTGGSTTITVAQSTFSVTSSWSKTTLNFNIPSINGKTVASNNHRLEVIFLIFKQNNTTLGDTLGNVGTWTTAAYLDLSRVQFESGTTATEFENRSPQAEMALCQRYYEKSYSYDHPPGTITNDGMESHLAIYGSYTRTRINYKVEKRDRGSVTIWNPATGSTVAGVAGRNFDSNGNFGVAISGQGTGGTLITYQSNLQATGNHIGCQWTCEADMY